MTIIVGFLFCNLFPAKQFVLLMQSFFWKSLADRLHQLQTFIFSNLASPKHAWTVKIRAGCPIMSLWQMGRALPWTSCVFVSGGNHFAWPQTSYVFMEDGKSFAMDVLWCLYVRWEALCQAADILWCLCGRWEDVLWCVYGRWEELCYGCPMFLWQMGGALPWMSYDVFMAGGKSFAMDIIWLWQMGRALLWMSFDVFVAGGKSFTVGILWYRKGKERVNWSMLWRESHRDLMEEKPFRSTKLLLLPVAGFLLPSE